MSAVETIFEQIRPLPVDQKRELVEHILSEFGDQLQDENLTPEQATELDRRLAEFEKNPHAGIPWEQVQAEVNQRFSWS